MSAPCVTACGSFATACGGSLATPLPRPEQGGSGPSSACSRTGSPSGSACCRRCRSPSGGASCGSRACARRDPRSPACRQSPQRSVICASCGYANPTGMRFCGQCGIELASSCPRCGADMPAGFVFCGQCGARLGASDATEGETRQITVLFADISGFTALAERLGPGELHETMRTVWDLIAADIRANGGIIEKYIGDAVVAAFGAVGDNTAAHPEEAQRAALAIIAALERANERIVQLTERRLALRVGVNTGVAVTGAIGDRESEFGVLGDAVNVAARLEQAAEPGEILVGDPTYRRTPGLFTYEPHPPIVARGKTAPVVAWRLVGPAAEAVAPDRRTALVGRDTEMAALLGALDDALAGRGRLVSILGEAGPGKSRAADEP